METKISSKKEATQSEIKSQAKMSSKSVSLKTVILTGILSAFLTATLTTGGLAGLFLLTKATSESLEQQRQTVVQEGEVIADVAQKTGQSVVSILTEQQTTIESFYFGPRTSTSRAAGTGVIIDSNGLILTNKHVVPAGTNMFFFQSYKVFGSSMVPTLHEGDRLIISKVGKTASRIRGKDYIPKRGDVIVFIDPQRTDLQLIKRVIGLPGERVVVKDGRITIYNTTHPKGFNPDTSGAYSADLPQTSGDNDVTVPEKHLFVSGDNRIGANSLDSRNELGTVPQTLVIGTLEVRIWPLNDAKLF